MPQLAQDPIIHAKLKEDFPFTYRPDPQRAKRPIREIVKSRLYCDDNLPNSNMEFMREHPEDMQWLKTHVRPRFWRKFVSEMNKWKPRGAPDIEE
jgi:hypothetical protein